MANSVMMYDVLGMPPERSRPRHRPQIGRESAGDQGWRGLLPALRLAGVGYGAGRPCVAGNRRARAPMPPWRAALEWLKPLQVLDVKGDWAEEKPDVRPGGWAFQYRNDYYPDLDDTAVVVMALDRAAEARRRKRITTAHRARRANGSKACRAGMAAGAPSTPTTPIIISTIFPSPITARCSIRRPKMSRAAASACWRNWASDDAPAEGGRGLSAPHTDDGRLLVRPLGRQLHLWHLVGAGGAECARAWRLTIR